MFGYVRPLIPELKVRELEDYKAVYCGLCRAMGKRYGLIARFTLNYDFAFLAMILAYQTDPCRFELCRCPVHPLKKRKTCLHMDALDVAADESLILSYQKLRDDAEDDGLLRGMGARIVARLLKPAYKKASKARPEFSYVVASCLEELHRMEQEQVRSIDRPADAFARILQAAAPDTGEPARDRAVRQMLYHVGRWIYLVDAWDDLAEDRKKQEYNPIEARYDGNAEEYVEEMRTTLLHSRNLATGAYELARSERWDAVLSNIMYEGLPAVEELVLTGRWQKNQKI